MAKKPSQNGTEENGHQELISALLIILTLTLLLVFGYLFVQGMGPPGMEP